MDHLWQVYIPGAVIIASWVIIARFLIMAFRDRADLSQRVAHLEGRLTERNHHEEVEGNADHGPDDH